MAELDVTVVRAAAGCGKTTDLARRYLGYLKAGFGVQQTIAITFTRRAAAELQERVSLALRAAGQGPAAEKARARLGSSWKLYESAAPRDPEVLATALEQLPDAPIGTTDSFIQRLLTEFALDVALPVPEGDPVPLDVPIAPGEGLSRALDRAARRILDPPDGGIDPRVEDLLEHLSLDEIRAAITRRSPYDDLRPAPATEILLDLAEDIARICIRHDLVATYGPADPTEVDDWVAALTPRTNLPGKWAVPAVARWLASGARPEEAPFELVGWLVGLNLQSQARKQLLRDLKTTERELGMGRLSLWDIVMALEYPFDADGHVELADRIREVLHELRQEVVGAGLRHAARSGELGHDELLDAAVALCRNPPPRLANRFRALLVDEVQDANPGQLRLYRALASLPGDHPVASYFVGDVRQSIYLFRNAEPQGLLEFERDSLKSGREPIELGTNFRSAPQLVQAQRDLFAAIDEPMRIRRWSPPPSLQNLKYHDGNAALHLDPDVHRPPDPVWLVHGKEVDVAEADRRALFTFLSRVRAAWERESGAEHDTAVVLTATWRQAQEACRQLRRWAGRDDIAFVDGGSGWTASRVGTDVALLLRALRDPTDDVAWLGVWKHPAVGLTDGGLARLRAGEGLVAYGPEGPEPAPDRCRVLGWAIDADALGPPHETADRGVFARVRNPLRHARDTLGRRGTAELLDHFVTELHWRTVLAAGPGGADDVAQLEVLLDWVRRQDQEGVPPELVIERLQDPRSELPHVHLSRSGQHILCTTTFQSKGLAWDHVCCLALGRVAGAVRGHEPAWMSLNGRRVRLEGVHFDPYGGITPFLDPLGRLARRLHQHRQGEESARLAYVALTRARRTVTVGLPTRGKSREIDVSTLLGDAWLAPSFRGEGVAKIPVGPLHANEEMPTGWAAADPDVDALWIPPLVSGGWLERTPSSIGAHLDARERLEQARDIVERVRAARGLFVGHADIVPPGQDPRTARPLPGHPLAGVRPSDWGEIAHGWLARWGFRGAVDPGDVSRYLGEAWGRPDAMARDWVVAICERLAATRGPLWDLVTDERATLHFELPLVGVGSQLGHDVLLTGRADLVVEHPDLGMTVVDFKAGSRSPTGFDDLVEAGGLKTYGPQLDAYAEAFEAMGKPVRAGALWFVRTGTSVLWA